MNIDDQTCLHAIFGIQNEDAQSEDVHDSRQQSSFGQKWKERKKLKQLSSKDENKNVKDKSPEVEVCCWINKNEPIFPRRMNEKSWTIDLDIKKSYLMGNFKFFLNLLLIKPFQNLLSTSQLKILFATIKKRFKTHSKLCLWISQTTGKSRNL